MTSLEQEPDMITLMGASGNTGKRIAHALLNEGEKVRALGRSRIKLAELEHLGADVRVGDTADAGFLTEAFRGSDAAYTLLPTDRRSPDYRARQDQEGQAIVHAIRASGVPYVVALSSLGAELSEGTGVIAGLHAQEERLKELGEINLLILRPVSFFENFLDGLEQAKQQGNIVDSVMPDLPVPMIAASDIAEAATKALRTRDWKGVVVRELLGPGELTYREATRILGGAIDEPNLEYVQLPGPEMINVLVEAGLSESFASLYVEMTLAFNKGTVKPLHGRNAENTTTTRFKEFARKLNDPSISL
jgi:uncharacterized protein YbjT (DUF2867 family)